MFRTGISDWGLTLLEIITHQKLRMWSNMRST